MKRLLGAGLLAALLAGCVAPPVQEPAEAPAAASTPDAPAAPAKPAARIAPRPAPHAPAPVEPAQAEPESASQEEAETLDGVLIGRGMASWYGPGFHGRRTASGERFDSGDLTAAHRTLPFGSRLCVRSGVNGKAVVVRVNDRGPYVAGRVIDLSQAAAQELGMMGLGIKPVEMWHLAGEDDSCPEGLPGARASRKTSATAKNPTRTQAKTPPKARRR